MAKETTHDHFADSFEPRVYTPYELEDFDKKIREKFTVKGKYVEGTMVDTLAFMKHVGSQSPAGAIMTNAFKNGILKYTYYQNLLDQWHAWLGRRQWGERKRLEGLDDLANQMKV